MPDTEALQRRGWRTAVDTEALQRRGWRTAVDTEALQRRGWRTAVDTEALWRPARRLRTTGGSWLDRRWRKRSWETVRKQMFASQM